MRITRAQSEQNKARVLETAVRLFRERGFDGAGVAEVMREAGMTHGGFYNHFESKEALEAEACAQIFEGAVAAIERVADAPERERSERLATYVRNYLSPRSRDAAGARCPMVAFGADVSRQGPDVQDAYAEGLARYLDAMARALGSPAEAARGEAIDLLVRLVGALSLARSVGRTDPALSDAILQRTLEQFGR
jgi:TetR/AcrR family transcriptional repressor of nem operon